MCMPNFKASRSTSTPRMFRRWMQEGCCSVASMDRQVQPALDGDVKQGVYYNFAVLWVSTSACYCPSRSQKHPM